MSMEILAPFENLENKIDYDDFGKMERKSLFQYGGQGQAEAAVC